EKLKKILVGYGFDVVNKKPDIVLCYGGDGTILYGERLYPSTPKLIIKTTGECREYDYPQKLLDSILKKVRNHNYLVLEEMKLEAFHKNNIITGLNEIQVHTKLPTRAVRFSLSVDNKKFENLVGDGIIVSTPFGSTGYYLATGGKQFKEGIGLSFNNLHSKKIFPFVVSENSRIKIRIERDSAILLSDNNPKYFSLEKGDEISIHKSSETARFILVNK
ncbi:MAG: NAD(+)/NADH kinase, partial [Actinobacteria bacterium]|nr:NAD(+)/NADH kinase [Actinomycetota bacterium]